MRLLDSTTLRLVSKREGDIPAYAILSHTWGGDDDEVTFQDIQELSASRMRPLNGSFAHRVTKKPGFAKIRDSARLAKSEGYEFIWIDTCCIDKTSSAELSEAINSMFRWYRDAAICYTFLNDVDETVGFDDYDRLTLLVQSIKGSRWFTRGWTLQELIAPTNVYFYSQNWTLLGAKLGEHLGIVRAIHKFPTLLSEITGIDLGVLNGNLILDDLSVANKMKWAANRQTTRVEDIAYCLMGIFNVNMPLLYGEGKRAFMRLQEEILRVTDDQSIFAWSCPENDLLRYQLSGLLASSPVYFRFFGDIKPMPPDPTRASAPSTMTNAGLHVQLYLSKSIRGLDEDSRSTSTGQKDDDTRDEYYAILDCYPRNSQVNGVWDYYNIAVRLGALGGDQHARSNAERVYWVPSSQMKSQGLGDNNRYIYVKQLPIYGLPDISVWNVDGDTGSQSFRLIDTHPSRRWNSETRILKPEISTYNSVLGVFRYAVQHNSSSDTTFTDVYVGISPGQRGPLSWHCWCFQLTVPSGGLERPHASALGMEEELAALRLSDRHAHQGIVANVESVRLQSKTYVNLHLSEIHELEADFQLTPPVSPSLTQQKQVHELDAEESTSGGLLTVVSEIPVIEDTWRSSLGLGDGTASQANARIRVLPHKSDDPDPAEPMGDSFNNIVTRAGKSDLKVDGGEATEGNMFQNYFSLLLVQACIKNDLDAATQLLDSPLSTALVEARTSIMTEQPEPWHNIFSGFRPLHWASALGHVDIVKLLDKHDADAGSITNSGLSAVHLAALSGSIAILNYIFEKTDHLAPRWFDAYHRAEKPAHLVASYIRTEEVNAILGKLMFEDGPVRKHASERYGVPDVGLESAAENNLAPEYHTNELALNKLRETPLHRAAAMNNILAAQCIISRAIERPLYSKDSFGRTPIWHAAAAGAVEIIRLFLEYGVNIDEPDNVGRTALHAACRVGKEDVVEELIQAGADVNAATQDVGFTACHFATLGNHANVLRILLKHGASPDQNAQGQASRVAPIHIAAANGFRECARVLVDAGCDIKSSSDHRIVVNSPNPSGVLVTKFKSKEPAELALLGSHIAVTAILLAASE